VRKRRNSVRSKRPREDETDEDASELGETKTTWRGHRHVERKNLTARPRSAARRYFRLLRGLRS